MMMMTIATILVIDIWIKPNETKEKKIYGNAFIKQERQRDNSIM